MAESKQERLEREVREIFQARDEHVEDQRKWAEDNRDDGDAAPETEEEALERIAQVRRTMIFGDTPTDPTIGDAMVPVNDEEVATKSQSEADVAEDLGSAEAAEQTPEEQKRQGQSGLSEEDLLDAEARESATAQEDAEARPNRSEKADEVIAKVREAGSADEVDSLVEGDERVTVQRAAAERKQELSEDDSDEE